MHRSKGRSTLMAFAIIAIASGLIQAGPASAASAPIDVTGVLYAEPGGDPDVLRLPVDRVAGTDPGVNDEWRLKADIFMRNTSAATDVTITRVTMSYPGSSLSSVDIQPIKITGDNADAATLQPGADPQQIDIFDGIDRTLFWPAPARARVTFEFDGFDDARMDFELFAYRNETPMGGYFFPGMFADLGPNQYWYWNGSRHVNNKSTGTQRYALDLTVVRWDPVTGSYVSTHADPVTGAPLPGSVNENHLVWGKPMHAMASGEVVSCRRDIPDQPPGGVLGETVTGSGNRLIIQNGSERYLIEHMMENSIPEDTCNPGVRVEAGEFIGRIGNTGQSTGPHIHFQIESNAGLPFDGKATFTGVPMHFFNVLAASHNSDVDALGPTPSLRRIDGLSLHARTLLRPNRCGIDLPDGTEHLRLDLHPVCLQDVVNETLVAGGYSPRVIDAFTLNGQPRFNLLFRKSAVPWGARAGMDGDEYQEFFDEMVEAGGRLHAIDAYVDGGIVRYSAIFDFRPGPGWYAYHGISEAAHLAELDEAKATGFVPVSVSAVRVGGDLVFAALYEQHDVTDWRYQMVAPQNMDAVNAIHEAQGRFAITFNGHSDDDGPHVSGVWVEPIDKQVGTAWERQGNNFVGTWRAQTEPGVGRATRSITGYESGGRPRFAGVWRGAPTTRILEAPPAMTSSQDARFRMGSDSFGVITFDCSLDGATRLPCGDPQTYRGLSEGSHAFLARAIDRDGVGDLFPPEHHWLIDITAPTVTIVRPEPFRRYVNDEESEQNEETPTVVGYVEVRATASDLGSGVADMRFTVNNQPVPSGDVSFDPLTDTWSFVWEVPRGRSRDHRITAFATDHVGNENGTSVVVRGIGSGNRPPGTEGLDINVPSVRVDPVVSDVI